MRVGGDRAVAEDLTQETMLALARTLTNPQKTIADPIAWLFGVARFKVIDHYRTTKDRELLAPWPGSEESDEPGDWDADLDAIVERDELLEALDQLAAGQRIALVLHYADGLSAHEIATALGKSAEAVESLLARGRRALRKILMVQGTTR